MNHFRLAARLRRRLLRAAVLALSLCLLLTGCAAAPDASSATEEPDSSAEAPAAAASLSDYAFTLPWYRGEGYNPYLTDNSLTVQLADLLFEKLVVIDPEARLEYRVVRAVTVEALTVTLTVDASYRYADGTAVSAQDVAACLQAARASKLYSGRFANVTDIRAGEGTVTVTLTQPDALFAWLLDIPVMPAGQTALEKPLASGRYTYAADGDALVPNPLSTAAAPFDRITLCEMTGADALANSLNIGAISLYASEGEALANGINSSRQASYYTNTLVFLGFNSIAVRSWKTTDVDGVETWHSQETGSSPLLAQVQGRQAINNLLDRSTLLEKVYYNRGHIADGYLNTVGPAAGHGSLHAEARPDEAAAALEALGYAKGLDGYYRTPGDGPDGQPVRLRLLVYTGSSYKRYLAQLIADALDHAGIQVETQECDTLEAYLQKIAALDFDLYIGEIKLYNDMDLSVFFAQTGAAAQGLSLSEALTGQYAAWRADNGQAAALEAALAAEMPWAPLLWRSGTLYYAKALDGFRPSVSSVFYDLGQLQLS